jgi:hypothetical protein
VFESYFNLRQGFRTKLLCSHMKGCCLGLLPMKLNDDLWSGRQYEVLVSFIQHLAYYRVLNKLYNDMRQRSEFWTTTINAHLLRAIIDWCMVFGTESNELHWKKVVTGKNIQRDFRRHLLSASSMTQNQWDDYWRDMTTFRNKYTAHRIAMESYPTTPKMDTALLVATTYDQWIRGCIKESCIVFFDEPSLQNRYDRITRISQKFLKLLVAAGPTVDQEYEGRIPQ